MGNIIVRNIHIKEFMKNIQVTRFTMWNIIKIKNFRNPVLIKVSMFWRPRKILWALHLVLFQFLTHLQLQFIYRNNLTKWLVIKADSKAILLSLKVYIWLFKMLLNYNIMTNLYQLMFFQIWFLFIMTQLITIFQTIWHYRHRQGIMNIKKVEKL